MRRNDCSRTAPIPRCKSARTRSQPAWPLGIHSERSQPRVLANKQANDAANSTLDKNRWLLENLAAPLADRPIAEITAAEILDLLKRIEKSGRRETARRLRGVIGSVFRYAMVTLRATSDPTLALQGALLAPKVNHRGRDHGRESVRRAFAGDRWL